MFPSLVMFILLASVPLGPVASQEGPLDLAIPPMMYQRADSTEGVSSAGEFVLDPGDGEWRRFSPASIRVRFLNESMDLIPERSILQLDGVQRPFAWNVVTRTLEARLEQGLADGVHYAEAILTHGDLSTSELNWTFGLDTQAPVLILEPLPSSTSSEALEVRGRVIDSWLVGLRVQGRELPLEDGNFASVIRLWPGPNDVLLEAEDVAGNRGRANQLVHQAISEYVGPMVPRTLENHGFSIDLPAEWAAQDDIRLPSGNRADLIALAPLEPGLETSLIVASERTSTLYPETRALEWMTLVLAGVSATGQLQQVVGMPRVLADPPGTVAVHSTFLRQTASMHVAFTQITMVWSDPLRTQWILIASVDIQRAIEMWPALNASVTSFRVLDEGIGGAEDPDPAFLVPMVVVTGAIAVLATIAFITLLPLYLSWRKTRNIGRWRPPRNWRL